MIANIDFGMRGVLTCMLTVAALAAGRRRAGGNPVITDIYTADPDAFVFNGRLYLDIDRDEAPLGVNDFLMREWHMYSSTDMVHWTDHGVRMTLADFPWANRNAWAPQMVHRDGRFYWYVPVKKASTNSMSIGVAVGDSPLGPFTRRARPSADRQHDAQPQRVRHRPDRAHRRRRPGVHLLGLVLVAAGGQAQAQHDRARGPESGRRGARPARGGRIGGAVKLNGASEYVKLPAGVVSGLTDFTIAAWVNPAADADLVAGLRLRHRHDARTCS